mgnify:CR=1 FL=1
MLGGLTKDKSELRVGVYFIRQNRYSNVPVFLLEYELYYFKISSLVLTNPLDLNIVT